MAGPEMGAAVLLEPELVTELVGYLRLGSAPKPQAVLAAA